MPTPLERTTEHALTTQIAALGGRALKWSSPGTTGVPDRIVLLPCGCTRLAELKRPGGVLSARQRAVIDDLATLGHLTVVLSSVADVTAWVECLARHVDRCLARDRPVR